MHDAPHEQTQPGYVGLKSTTNAQSNHQVSIPVPRLVHVPNSMEQTLFSE